MFVADAPVPAGLDRGQSVLDRDVAQPLVIELSLPGQQVAGADVGGGDFADEGPLPSLADGEVAPLGEQVLPLLVQVAATVALQPVQVQVAQHFRRDGGAA